MYQVHENFMKNQILQIMSKIDDTLPWEDFDRGEFCTENVHQGTVFSIIILIGKYRYLMLAQFCFEIPYTIQN